MKKSDLTSTSTRKPERNKFSLPNQSVRSNISEVFPTTSGVMNNTFEEHNSTTEKIHVDHVIHFDDVTNLTSPENVTTALEEQNRTLDVIDVDDINFRDDVTRSNVTNLTLHENVTNDDVRILNNTEKNIANAILINTKRHNVTTSQRHNVTSDDVTSADVTSADVTTADVTILNLESDVKILSKKRRKSKKDDVSKKASLQRQNETRRRFEFFKNRDIYLRTRVIKTAQPKLKWFVKNKNNILVYFCVTKGHIYFTLFT